MAFFSLEIGKKALQTAQISIDVTGHNISNANTEGYSRQNTNLEALQIRDPRFGTMGSSVDVTSVTRTRNQFLDDRMLKEQPEKARWDVRESNLGHIEAIFNEPSDQSIRTILDSFWKSIQDLNNSPEDAAVRQSVKERALDLTNTINGTFEQLKALKSDLNENISTQVFSINSYLQQIAKLNKEITTVEANKQESNDLRDKRDLITEQLSKIIDVQVSRGEKEYSIIIGGKSAVQGWNYQSIKLDSERSVNNGLFQLKWTNDDQEVKVSNGQLKGMLELRDEDINKYTDYLDQLSISLVDRVNEVNQSGFDIHGQQGQELFGGIQTNAERVDIDKDGYLEADIYKVKGNKALSQAVDVPLSSNSGITAGTGTFEVNGMQVSYDTTKESMQDIVEKINNTNSGIVAATDPYNRLTFRAVKDDNYIIRSFEDTSGKLLQELGLFNTGKSKFHYKDATTLNDISSTDRMAKPIENTAQRMFVKLEDYNKIAAAKGKDTNGDNIPDVSNGVGDGSNALELASLRYTKSIGKYSFSDYFASMISDLGISSQQATRSVSSQGVLIDSLEQRRQSDIGVNIDEEMTSMIKYQQSYNAASKFINTVNAMLDTLMNKL